VQINPKYAEYFSEEDLAQREIIPVSPVDLALNDPEQTLTLDPISNHFNIFEEQGF
jgi:hypothetical protein